MDSTSRDDTRQLRRTMRDLVALSTLPAVWVGLSPDAIARSLADTLLNTLVLDIAVVRVWGLTSEALIDVVRHRARPDSLSTEEQSAGVAELSKALETKS